MDKDSTYVPPPTYCAFEEYPGFHQYQSDPAWRKLVKTYHKIRIEVETKDLKDDPELRDASETTLEYLYALRKETRSNSRTKAYQEIVNYTKS